MQTCYGRAFDVRTATTQFSPATIVSSDMEGVPGLLATCSGRNGTWMKPVDRFCHCPNTLSVRCRHQQAFDADITHIAVQPLDGFP